MSPTQTSNASAAKDWLGGALLRSLFVIAVAVVFMVTGDAARTDIFVTALLAGFLWFLLMETLILLLILRSARPRQGRRRY